MSTTILPRRVAADILIDVLDRGRTLDEALNLSKDLNGLGDSDRGFVRAMLLPTLRELGRIDAALEAFLDKPLMQAPASARALLRLGATQSWILETPDHAVVSESVDVAKSWPEAQRAHGFINAVLRKVVADRDVFDDTPIRFNWPQWLWQDLSDSLDEENALNLLRAQSEQPNLHLTPKSMRSDALAEKLGGSDIGVASVEIASQPVERIPGYETGDWWVQDAAAALPAILLDPQPGDRIADICAAPGGKTMQISAAGADVVAIDRSRPRLRRLKQNLKRVGLPDVDVIEADAETWKPDLPFDKILLDAPCSALGTLRRHPEGAWIKTQEDVARFADIQRRLLLSTIDKLSPGGVMIYCVCSPRPQEGLDVISDGLNAGLVRKPFSTEEVGPFARSITEHGDLLTLPTPEFAHDAFFICRLVRYV